MQNERMKTLSGLLAVAVLAFGASAVALGSTAAASSASKLAPVGAREPKTGVHLESCDPVSLDPPGGVEGSCALDANTVVAADKAHSVALTSLSVDVLSVKQITTIKIGSGSIHPLATDAWIAIKVQVKNTSGKAAQLRDEQFNLRLGTTRSEVHPEATSSEPDSLTKTKQKLGNGKVRSGTLVFAVPVADAGMVSTAPSALLFAGFGGDWAFSQFPRHVFGLIRLSR